MLEDFKKEMLEFVNDITHNLKSEEDILYVTERTSKLVDMVMKEMEKIMTYKEDKMNAIIRKQEQEEQKLEELKEKVDNVYEDIYEEGEDSFLISCPYCAYEFEADIDETLGEIRCPECENIIELDWNGNPDDENEQGCSGGCSHCGGCE